MNQKKIILKWKFGNSGRCHLTSARDKLEEHLVQSQQVVEHYRSLGEDFTLLAQQYHDILTDIDNKQWALAELTKTS